MTRVMSRDSESAQNAPSLAEVVDRHGVRARFDRNTQIYSQDDEVEMLYRVVSGVVRTSRLTVEGRRQVGDFYYPGDLFGLEPGPEHRFAAEALEDCEVLAVRRSTVRAAHGQVALDRAILEAQRLEMERLQDHIVMLGRRTARERVASFLMAIAQKGGGQSSSLAMGRQDIADYLGLTVETVSRMLTQLQGEAIVAFPSSRQFQIRKWNALEALAA
jgi:CRP/FNR family nitrogen fixation transcriptional regulator